MRRSEREKWECERASERKIERKRAIVGIRGDRWT